MGQAHHRDFDSQIQRRAGWLEFAGGRRRRRSRHARRSERAIFDHGGLHQAHAPRSRRYRQRLQKTWTKTAVRHAAGVIVTTTKSTKVTKKAWGLRSIYP